MNSEELTKKWKAKTIDGFKVEDVTTINHHPHPFMIGAAHVSHAADHHGGVLREETLQAIPCAMGGCYLNYEEHTSELALFLVLTRNLTAKEANSSLLKIVKEVEEDGIDGFAFIEDEFKITE